MQTAGAYSGGGVVNFPMLLMLLLYTEQSASYLTDGVRRFPPDEFTAWVSKAPDAFATIRLRTGLKPSTPRSVLCYGLRVAVLRAFRECISGLGSSWNFNSCVKEGLV
jgi:hypothetical protein